MFVTGAKFRLMNGLLLNLLIFVTTINPGPKLFNSLPDQIHIQVSAMGNLLTNESIGSKITLNSQENVPLKVELIQVKKWSDNEKTVAYKLLGYPEGTRLVINIIHYGNQTQYRGQLLHMSYSDAYQVTFNGSELILTKTDTDHIVVE